MTGANACPTCGSPLGGGEAFCPRCGGWLRGEASPGSAPGGATAPGSSGAVAGAKDRIAAGVLAILLGGLGIHKFYLGQWGWGILFFLFCWSGIPSTLGIIDGILILVKTDADFQRAHRGPADPFGPFFG